MKPQWCATLLALASLASATASPQPDTPDEKPPAETLKPCQIRSPNTGSFFDLNPIRVQPPLPKETNGDDSYPSTGVWKRDVRTESWHARGHDYGANFTINFCGPVIEDIRDVVGVDESRWTNVSAFYVKDNLTFSLGQANDELVFRGRKMTLNYTDGSPCDPPTTGHTNMSDVRTKSALINILCERDSMATMAASVAFVGTMDECTYFFEARSHAACATINAETVQVSPSGVFILIACVAILVYLLGGIVYQRAVKQQRGWRQVPNYSLWAGIVGFVRDLLLLVFNSCYRCFAGGRGYKPVVNGANQYANGLPSSRRADERYSDYENRLIDQLDEEWDD